MLGTNPQLKGLSPPPPTLEAVTTYRGYLDSPRKQPTVAILKHRSPCQQVLWMLLEAALHIG